MVLEVRRSEAGEPAAEGTRPYVAAPGPEGIRTAADVYGYLLQVVRHEGHRDLLITRLRTAAGYGRVGANIRAWLEHMLQSAVDASEIRVVLDAYYADPAQLR